MNQTWGSLDELRISPKALPNWGYRDRKRSTKLLKFPTIFTYENFSTFNYLPILEMWSVHKTSAPSLNCWYFVVRNYSDVPTSHLAAILKSEPLGIDLPDCFVVWELCWCFQGDSSSPDSYQEWENSNLDVQPSRRLRLFKTRAETRKKLAEHNLHSLNSSYFPPAGALQRSLSTPQFHVSVDVPVLFCNADMRHFLALCCIKQHCNFREKVSSSRSYRQRRRQLLQPSVQSSFHLS